MKDEISEKHMRRTYDAVARRYREDDQREITTPNHCRLCSVLTAVCQFYDRPIRVLEVGCGTGRYFHCLRNTEQLVGMDVSPGMLEQARNPVLGDNLQIANTRLIAGNVYTHSFPPGSFDFIYALGVFGNGCALNVDLINKFHKWLSSDGTLYVDVIDTSTDPMPLKMRMHLRNLIHSTLPAALRERWNQRSGWLPFYMADPTSVLKLMRKTEFERFSVERVVCQLTLGLGAKIECIATKSSRLIEIPTHGALASK